MRLLLTADPEIEVPPRPMAASSASSMCWCAACRRPATRSGSSPRPARAVRPMPSFPGPAQRSQSKADTLSNGWTLCEGQARFPARPRAQLLAHRLSAAASARTGAAGDVVPARSDTAHGRARRRRLAAPGMLTFTGCSEYIARIGRPSGGEWLGIHNFADTENLHFSPGRAGRRAAGVPEPGRAHQGRALGDRDRAPYRPAPDHRRQPLRHRAGRRATGERRSCRRSAAMAWNMSARSTTCRRTSCWAGPRRWSCRSGGTSRSASSSPNRWPAARR